MGTKQKLQGRHKKKHVFPINLLVSKAGTDGYFLPRHQTSVAASILGSNGILLRGEHG